jgi:hypothetical protein
MSVIGSCHCGKTAFRVDAEMPTELTRCTCSFCAKRGALLMYCEPGSFHLTRQPADDAVYRWQTRQVAHHFCAHCGCATFSDSPAFEPDGKWDGSTRRIGINARLLDDFDAALAPVVVIDGRHLW